MRMSRRMAICASGARAFEYAYTGQSYFDGDPKGNWVLYLLTSGYLTITSISGLIDIFVLGGGGGAMSHGGGGGHTRTFKGIDYPAGTYPVEIGAGGAAGIGGAGGVGGASGFNGLNATGGNADGSGGSGGGSVSFWGQVAESTPGSNGANGGGGIAGQGTSTTAFGDVGWALYAGGGAAYCASNDSSRFYPIAGGAGGGGDNGLDWNKSGSPGVANYGGGGGNGTVSNIIWGMIYQEDEFNTDTTQAVIIEGLPVHIGDSYDGTDFWHNGGKVYRSKIDNNVYAPSEYPAGWEEVANEHNR